MKKIYLVFNILIMSFILGSNINGQSSNVNINLINSTQSIYVNSFDLVPVTPGNLEDGNDLTKVGIVTLNPAGVKYVVSIQHPDGNTYTLGNEVTGPKPIEIPKTANNKSELIRNSARYYTNGNHRFLFIEYQNPSNPNNIDKSMFDMDVNDLSTYGFRPTVTWNLTTGKYEVNEKLTLFGVVHVEPLYKASYLDVFFPIDLDELLMYEFTWSYRYQRFYGMFGYTDWRKQYAFRTINENVDASDNWNYVTNFFIKHHKEQGYYNNEKLDKSIRRLDLDNDVKNKNDYQNNYTKKVNKRLTEEGKPGKTRQELFNGEHSMYRVYMDTYDDIGYTGFEIRDDIETLSLMYMYKGELFYPAFDDIEFIGSGGGNIWIKIPTLPGFGDNNPVKEYMWVIWIIIGMFSVWFISGIIGRLRR